MMKKKQYSLFAVVPFVFGLRYSEFGIRYSLFAVVRIGSC